jgi:Carboxypeptidase regulatory-like domain
MRRLTVMALAAMLCVLLSSVTRAQRLDGTLRVTVTDNSQATIEEAKVTAQNEATGVATTTSASSAGTYVFPNLLVGTYTVTVEKGGFKKAVEKGISVGSNQVAEAKVELEVGSVSAVVEVEAGAELVKTQSSDLDTTFGGKIASDLPINTVGGSVLEFAVFAPGTTTQQGGVAGSGGSIGGNRPRFNGFSIDGVDDNRTDVNGPATPVIQDSVAEFTLITNQFSAEYGHSAGGQFSIVTKSGTNNFHGQAHWYNQNRNYNAMDNLQKDRGHQDRFDYNRAGGDFGGPIKRDKLFFFGAYEYQNNGLASSSPTVQVPTQNGLAQILAQNPDAAVQAALAQFPIAPTKTGTVTVNGQPIDVGTFQSIAPSYFNENDLNANIDANLGKNQIRARYLYDRFRSPSINSSQPQSQFNGTEQNGAHKFILTDAWSMKPNLINDARVSYSRTQFPELTIPTGFTNFPNIEIDELGTNVGPNGNAPQGGVQNVYQGSDAVTYIKGKHTLKAGIEFRRYIVPVIFLPRARGEWDYASLQSFVNDLVPDGGNGALQGQGSGVFAANNSSIYWFVQDDFKVTRRLVVNLGLRYEWSGIPRDSNRQVLNSVADDPSLGIFFRKPTSDKNNFAPRFGFAYDPLGNGKWAIRGGAGLAFDVTPSNFAYLQLPPQVQYENNPDIACGLPTAPTWCASGQGFLQGGALGSFVAPTDQATARLLAQGLITDQVQPKVLTWTLSVQHEINNNTSVEVRYLGTHAVSLPTQVRLNQQSAFSPSLPGGPLASLPTYFSAADVPATVVAPTSTLETFDTFNNAPLAADGFGSVFTTFQPWSQSIYHSGSVDLTHRFTRGLYLRTNYTFAKTIDDGTNELFTSRVNPRRAEDGLNTPLERGLSALNIPHKFTLTWVYELPIISQGNGFVRGLVNGWEVSGTYLAQKGQPITALSGSDANANGDVAGDRTIFNPSGSGLTGSAVNAVCNAGPGGATSIVGIDPISPFGAWQCGTEDDSNIVGYVVAPATVGVDAGTIDPTARFIQAQVGSKTNVGRNTVQTPGLNVWNIGLLKTTSLGERLKVQFRAETYNTFNHRNFSIGLPTNNGNIDSTTNPNPLSTAYPFVTAGPLFLNNHQFTGGSRTMQLGLKLIF